MLCYYLVTHTRAGEGDCHYLQSGTKDKKGKSVKWDRRLRLIGVNTSKRWEVYDCSAKLNSLSFWNINFCHQSGHLQSCSPGHFFLLRQSF